MPAASTSSGAGLSPMRDIRHGIRMHGKSESVWLSKSCLSSFHHPVRSKPGGSQREVDFRRGCLIQRYPALRRTGIGVDLSYICPQFDKTDANTFEQVIDCITLFLHLSRFAHTIPGEGGTPWIDANRSVARLRLLRIFHCCHSRAGSWKTVAGNPIAA